MSRAARAEKERTFCTLAWHPLYECQDQSFNDSRHCIHHFPHCRISTQNLREKTARGNHRAFQAKRTPWLDQRWRGREPLNEDDNTDSVRLTQFFFFSKKKLSQLSVRFSAIFTRKISSWTNKIRGNFVQWNTRY
jgi:hypothetical protein